MASLRRRRRATGAGDSRRLLLRRRATGARGAARGTARRGAACGRVGGRRNETGPDDVSRISETGPDHVSESPFAEKRRVGGRDTTLGREPVQLREGRQRDGQREGRQAPARLGLRPSRVAQGRDRSDVTTRTWLPAAETTGWRRRGTETGGDGRAVSLD